VPTLVLAPFRVGTAWRPLPTLLLWYAERQETEETVVCPQFLWKLKIKPSEVQQYFDSLSEENEVNGCYILVSRETLADH
jgi:hypothetical protein